jgi:fructosamine-3-kinase
MQNSVQSIRQWLLGKRFHEYQFHPSSLLMISNGKDNSFLSALNIAIERSLGRRFEGEFIATGAGLGGSGASTMIIRNKPNSNINEEYFVKISSASGYDMLKAEFEGIKEIHDSNTIKVPRPICYGISDYNAFVVFEKLRLGGYGDPSEGGRLLAKMHMKHSANGKYGWKMNNTIGATFQPNPWTNSWSEFWDEYQLGHMIKLCKMEGATFPQEKELRQKVRSILDDHVVTPSLVHGDLWSGNFAYTSDGIPVIFDPAVYYGDRF